MSTNQRQTDEAFKEALKSAIDEVVIQHIEAMEAKTEFKQLTINDFCDRGLDTVLVLKNIMCSYLMMVVSLEDNADLGRDFLQAVCRDFDETLKVLPGLQEEITDILTKSTSTPTKH